MEYYVYVFCDPRKPGIFKYLDWSFNFEPFYVGSGKGSRYKRHLNKSQLKFSNNPIKNGKLKHIIKDGYNPLDYVVILINDLSEEQSRNQEILLIKQMGRIDLKSGPLANLTDGGEGMSNHISGLKGRTYEDIHGLKKAAELKKEKSNRFIGSKNPMFGKHSWNKGKHMAQKSKILMSQKHSISIKGINIKNNKIKIWPSIKKAAKSLGIVPTAIGNCLKGRSNSSGGYRWIYLDK